MCIYWATLVRYKVLGIDRPPYDIISTCETSPAPENPRQHLAVRVDKAQEMAIHSTHLSEICNWMIDKMATMVNTTIIIDIDNQTCVTHWGKMRQKLGKY